MAHMNTNMKREWNDDDRDTKDYIQHYSEGFDKKQISILHCMKEVIRDEYSRINNIHWNEVEYRSYANEPTYVPYDVVDIVDETVENKEASVAASRDDEDDLTYQGLVKNKFMYS